MLSNDYQRFPVDEFCVTMLKQKAKKKQIENFYSFGEQSMSKNANNYCQTTKLQLHDEI